MVEKTVPEWTQVTPAAPNTSKSYGTFLHFCRLSCIRVYISPE